MNRIRIGPLLHPALLSVPVTVPAAGAITPSTVPVGAPASTGVMATLKRLSASTDPDRVLILETPSRIAVPLTTLPVLATCTENPGQPGLSGKLAYPSTT